MSLPSNPFSTNEPWNLVAEGYAETTMQMLAQYAEEAIAACSLARGATVLDVACGPGTLALIAAHDAGQVHGIDFSEAMLTIFRKNAARAGYGNISILHGDAQALPYPDAMFDTAFSMFGLMFFPDRRKGYAEIHRTLKPGGKIAVTSWAPVDQSPAMKILFGALRAIKPDLPQPQRSLSTLENPAVFEQELQAAGFHSVEIRSVTKPFPVLSIQEFWESLVKGSAPIQMLKKSMGDPAWRENEILALNYLAEKLPVTPTSLTCDAWLGLGIK